MKRRDEYMTLQKWAEDEHFDKDYPIMKKKDFDKRFKHCLRTSRFCDIYVNYYENEKYLNDITWQDVEGIGYGWLWCNYKLRSKFKFLQRRAVKKYIKREYNYIPKDKEMLFYYSLSPEGSTIRNYVWQDGDKNVFILVRFSNLEFIS